LYNEKGFKEMLNWNTVLKYIKNRLSLPSSFIELNDDQIRDCIITKTIPEFSQYYPDQEYTTVLVNNQNYRHEFRKNWFYFFDEENLDIYGIKECYAGLEQEALTGHPLYEPMTFSSMPWWSLDVFKSRFLAPFTRFNYTFKFQHPNLIQVLPGIDANFAILYEREQPHDLSRIPNSLKGKFMDLCLAETKIVIGSIRNMYGQGQIITPFGEINLNGDVIKQEGEDLRRELIEKMEEDSMPSVVIDIG